MFREPGNTIFSDHKKVSRDPPKAFFFRVQAVFCHIISSNKHYLLSNKQLAAIRPSQTQQDPQVLFSCICMLLLLQTIQAAKGAGNGSKLGLRLLRLHCPKQGLEGL